MIDNAIRMRTDEPDYRMYFVRGLILSDLRRYDEAIAHFNKSIEMGSHSLGLVAQALAKTYFLKSDTNKALEVLANLIEGKQYQNSTLSERLDARLFSAQIHEAMGNDSSALADLEQIDILARFANQESVTAARKLKEQIQLRMNTRLVNLRIERFITPYGVPIEGTMICSIVILGTIIDMPTMYHQDYHELTGNYKKAKITATQIREPDGNGYKYKDVHFIVESKSIDRPLPSFHSPRSPR